MSLIKCETCGLEYLDNYYPDICTHDRVHEEWLTDHPGEKYLEWKRKKRMQKRQQAYKAQEEPKLGRHATGHIVLSCETKKAQNRQNTRPQGH